MTIGCNQVSRFLDGFLQSRNRDDAELNALSAHAGECSACRERLARFFHTVELPESTYLRETVDELAFTILNLARALIRDDPDGASTENVRITESGGGTADENLSASDELLGDAEEFTGSTDIGGLNLEEVRADLEGVQASRKAHRIDLALKLFHRITTLSCRHHDKAWNWIGVLRYQREEFAAAEEAFQKVLSDPAGARDARAFAHCNLAYAQKHLGDLDRAVRSAERAVALAEEDGQDPYFGRFAAIYLRLLRHAEGDAERAEAHGVGILTGGGRTRLLQDLHLPSNAPVLEVVRNSALAARLGLASGKS